MSWSKLKSGMEGFLAEAVKGRIGLHHTNYRRPGCSGETREWITVDGEELINLTEKVQYVRSRLSDDGQHELVRQFELESRWEAGRLEDAMAPYQELSIEAVLTSADSVIRALGMLDRRLGKRRLARMDVTGETLLAKFFYLLRCGVEGVRPTLQEDGATLKERLIRAHCVEWGADPAGAVAGPANGRLPDSADLKLAAAGRNKPAQVLRRLLQGEVAEGELPSDAARTLFHALQGSPDCAALRELLLKVGDETDLLESNDYAGAVVALASRPDRWLRPVATWEAKSYNSGRQFASLARHLLANYEVPRFMDRVWFTGGAREQEWFRHLGVGKNMRTAEGLPIAMSKRMAHHFLQAPDDFTVEAAFRWGQVRSLDGDPRLARAFCETRLVREFRDDQFWLSVIRFFVANPMLDRAHVQPIIDYIWNQRYEPVVVFVQRGVAEERPPEQPNFTMRGRTPEALLRAVDAWHERLGRKQSVGVLQWRKSAIPDFLQEEGSDEGKARRVWRIRELVSSEELFAEGREQGHCVASYARSCHAGRCSIWTMDLQTSAGIEKCVTIEVGLPEGEIRQVRGQCNRLARSNELQVVRNWASQNGLRVAHYL